MSLEKLWWQVPGLAKRRWRTPWGLLAAVPASTITEVGDINGGPLGVLLASPAVATTKDEDVDRGPSGGCCR
jgi:hypothetical protein